eukprot:CAMPEP_0119079838 /NCGR_PEP_ID=MMETSP1178-20130426/109415_1 /TAXON_ID=33656 /ORGANISM="unid sp, Strain CCMP2000" /LENGTH=135 /DNA_ID=CAMNT_0007062389 /DNA_START=200 /DNA_END=605 /DNA_ORIENTATION=-
MQVLALAVRDGGEECERHSPRRVEQQGGALAPTKQRARAIPPLDPLRVRDRRAPDPAEPIAAVRVRTKVELVGVAVLVVQQHVEVPPAVLPEEGVLVRRVIPRGFEEGAGETLRYGPCQRGPLATTTCSGQVHVR